MPNDLEGALRKHVITLLEGRGAHVDFNAAVADIPESKRGIKPRGFPHTAWQLVEHLRIAQHDILEFSRNTKYKAPTWPDDYWPQSEAPPNERAWDVSVGHFVRDQAEFVKLISNPDFDLMAPLPHAPEGQTLLREALVLADHNSYHIGQLVLLRRGIGEWS